MELSHGRTGSAPAGRAGEGIPASGRAVLCRPALWFPEHTVTLEETLELIRRRHSSHDQLDAVLRMIENSGVRRRRLVQPSGEMSHAATAARTRFYLREVRRALPGVVDEALQSADLPVAGIDAVVFVSCAGVPMPPITSWMINTMGFRSGVWQIPVAGPGSCAGGVAVDRAYDLRTTRPGSDVLVVACEFGSFGGQPSHPDAGALLSGALSGDAIAAAVVRGPGAGGLTLRRNASSAAAGPLPHFLGLPPGAFGHSRELLGDYGDIASAAVLAALQKFLDHDRP